MDLDYEAIAREYLDNQYLEHYGCIPYDQYDVDQLVLTLKAAFEAGKNSA